LNRDSADQDADLISPDFSGGGAAPADVRLIHDVVVQERGRVDKLNQAAELMVAAAAITADAGREE